MSFLILDDNSPRLAFDSDTWQSIPRDGAFNRSVHIPQPGKIARMEFAFEGLALEIHLSFPASTAGEFGVEFNLDGIPTQINGTYAPTNIPPTFTYVPRGLTEGKHNLIVTTSSKDVGIDYLLFIPSQQSGTESPHTAVIVGGVVTGVVFLCTIMFLAILYIKRYRKRKAPDELGQSDYPVTPSWFDRLADYLRRRLERNPVSEKVEQIVTPVYIRRSEGRNRHRAEISISSHPMSIDPPSDPPVVAPPRPTEERQSRRVFMVMNPSSQPSDD